jgi:hypothetical protein
MLQLWRDLKQYERFKQEDRPLELLHLKMRTLMRGITTALEKERGNQELPARLQQLQEELVNLERRAPWIVADYPVEMALWGDRAGLL